MNANVSAQAALDARRYRSFRLWALCGAATLAVSGFTDYLLKDVQRQGDPWILVAGVGWFLGFTFLVYLARKDRMQRVNFQRDYETYAYVKEVYTAEEAAHTVADMERHWMNLPGLAAVTVIAVRTPGNGWHLHGEIVVPKRKGTIPSDW